MKTDLKTRSMTWGDQIEENCCALCGKRLKKIGGWVHVIDGGALILHPDDEDRYEENLVSDMGFHPVGPRCVKKLRGWTHEIP